MQTDLQKNKGRSRILEISLEDEIDHLSAARLSREIRREIMRQRPEKLILDFKKVTMMDSSGIGLLLGRYKQMKDYGGELAIKNTSKQVDKVLTLSGLYQIIRKI